jgi:diaminopimelate epimerase
MSISEIHFTKMSGLGNDFIIIDNRKKNITLNSAAIKLLADRKIIGCDQLIIIKYATDQNSDYYMEIYNSDGSESPTCGNATRCVAGLIMEEENQEIITIETKGGILKCWREGWLISVAMAYPQFLWSKIPVANNIDTNEVFFDDDIKLSSCKFHLVNLGNPHAVTFLNAPISDEDFFYIGSKIESHPFFPQKTNVEFAHVINDNLIEVRVFERGVGETLACGSGACAVGVLAIKNKLVQNNKIITRFKGGDLTIEWQNQNSPVIMSGEYKKIFTGIFFTGIFNLQSLEKLH